jgi:hypothetical protein
MKPGEANEIADELKWSWRFSDHLDTSHQGKERLDMLPVSKLSGPSLTGKVGNVLAVWIMIYQLLQILTPPFYSKIIFSLPCDSLPSR